MNHCAVLWFVTTCSDNIEWINSAPSQQLRLFRVPLRYTALTTVGDVLFWSTLLPCLLPLQHGGKTIAAIGMNKQVMWLLLNTPGGRTLQGCDGARGEVCYVCYASFRLYAMGLSICLSVRPSVRLFVAKMCTKNAIFSKTKQFKLWSLLTTYRKSHVGFSKNPFCRDAEHGDCV